MTAWYDRRKGVCYFVGRSLPLRWIPLCVLGQRCVQLKGLWHGQLITHRRIATGCETATLPGDWLRNRRRFQGVILCLPAYLGRYRAVLSPNPQDLIQQQLMIWREPCHVDCIAFVQMQYQETKQIVDAEEDLQDGAWRHEAWGVSVTSALARADAANPCIEYLPDGSAPRCRSSLVYPIQRLGRALHVRDLKQ